MKQNLTVAVLLLMSGALLALAETASKSNEKPNAAADESQTRGGVMVEAYTAVFTVDSIEAGTRDVVLRRSDNSLTAYRCGSDIRNFDQIKVGDHVTATVAQEVVVVLAKDDLVPTAGTATVIVRSPKGAKPGGRLVGTRGFTAKVMSVDTEKREVTLQMIDGKNKIVEVGPDINLANVKPGDDVGVKVTRAIAIAVEEQPTAQATPQN